MTDVADASVLYVRSYLLIRTVVGTLGALLPTLLFRLFPDGAAAPTDGAPGAPARREVPPGGVRS